MPYLVIAAFFIGLVIFLMKIEEMSQYDRLAEVKGRLGKDYLAMISSVLEQFTKNQILLINQDEPLSEHTNEFTVLEYPFVELMGEVGTRVSGGAGARVAKGVYVGGSVGRTVYNIEKIDSGPLKISTLGIYFLGGSKTLNFPYKDLIDVSLRDNCLRLATKKSAKTHYLSGDLETMKILVQLINAIRVTNIQDWSIQRIHEGDKEYIYLQSKSNQTQVASPESDQIDSSLEFTKEIFDDLVANPLNFVPITFAIASRCAQEISSSQESQLMNQILNSFETSEEEAEYIREKFLKYKKVFSGRPIDFELVTRFFEAISGAQNPRIIAQEIIRVFGEASLGKTEEEKKLGQIAKVILGDVRTSNLAS